MTGKCMPMQRQKDVKKLSKPTQVAKVRFRI